MAASIAINGFGRIGRMVFRQAIVQEELNVVAINARYPLETLAHLSNMILHMALLLENNNRRKCTNCKWQACTNCK